MGASSPIRYWMGSPALQADSFCLSHQGSPSLGWALRKLRVWEYQRLAPNSWGAYQRNDFNEPRLLYLPINIKATNSLTWDTWLSLINNHLLMFRLSSLCCKVKWSKVKSLSSVRLFVTPWTVAYHTPPSMGFSRQEYWSRVPFLPPEDLPDPGIEPRCPAL